MKRRSFFGALAGVFGAPVAAKMVTVTKEANDAFGHAGELVERDVPKDWQIESRDARNYGMATLVSGYSYSSMTCAWDGAEARLRRWDEELYVWCSHCGSRRPNDEHNCDRCGAPI